MAIDVSSVVLETGLTVSCATVGDLSGAPVLFLPGPTDSWVSYAPVLELLPTSIRAIAVSQRGHGDSDKPTGGYRVADFAADVLMLFDALDIARAVVAGHSGSCPTVRRVAIDHPERVAGLVLEAPLTTLRGNADLTGLVDSVISALEDPIDPAFARSFVSGTSSERLDPEMVDRLAREVMKVPAGAWQQMFADLLVYDDLSEIDRITAPALLVWGDADELVSREMQTILAAGLANAALTVYEGVGHAPRWEEPSRFATDVAAFTHRSIRTPA